MKIVRTSRNRKHNRQLHAGKTGEKFRGILPTTLRHRSAFGKVSQAILSGRLALFFALFTPQPNSRFSYRAEQSERFLRLNRQLSNCLTVQRHWAPTAP